MSWLNQLPLVGTIWFLLVSPALLVRIPQHWERIQSRNALHVLTALQTHFRMDVPALRRAPVLHVIPVVSGNFLQDVQAD
jgi:hypothetical protein